MNRRNFMNRAAAFMGCLSLGLIIVGREPRGMNRPIYRNSTEGSVKWQTGHNAGCVLYAPDDECICEEFGGSR